MQSSSMPDDLLLDVGVQKMTGLSRTHTFEFSQFPANLRCRLHEKPEEDATPPDAWWLHAKGRNNKLAATIKLNDAFHAGVLGQRTLRQVSGQFYPTIANGVPELLCRSPLQVGRVVRLRENAARGTLALATSEETPALRCAFLAVGRGWKAGEQVSCVAIQHAPLADLRRLTGFSDGDLKHLRRMPIVVPLDVLGDDPSARGSSGGKS